MKKLILMAAVMLASVGAYAQHAVGSFTLQPKVGVSIANLTDSKADSRVGFVGGVEGEYQVTDIFSISGAALYSMQGAKKDDVTTKLDYINVPIMANVYVVKGLAVKLGIQPGFKVNASAKADNVAVDFDKAVQTVDFSIPVGVSYEYQNFVLDARYNWGLTNVAKKDYFDTKSKNSVFQITLGYKFDL
ncbi:porin family protein [Prevotella corporis]|uniref:porin family protein n=1 Tax=Prevotella corporis TaxID=28128 RepID=UPI002366A8FD|nr:porin family protein [Prevotella corporis]